MRRPNRLSLTLVLLVAGCSIGRFDDLETSAPAVRISGDGAFGQPTVGLAQPEGTAGGLLLIGGGDTGEISLVTANFSASGSYLRSEAVATAENESFSLDDGTLLAMAPLAYADAIGSAHGPFAYVAVHAGSVRRVALLDVLTFERVGQPLTATRSEVSEFACALAPARLQGGPVDVDGQLDEQRYDLVVGAQGEALLFLHDGAPGSWVDRQGEAVSGTGDDAIPGNGALTRIAVGNLNPASDEDEIVIAVPERNYVAIIDNVSGTPRVGKLPVPPRADQFGAALLVANVDGGSTLEVVVGASATDSGKGALYIHKLLPSFFSSGMNPAYFDDADSENRKRVEIRAPGGAMAFGAALAYGPLDGTGEDLLAVGAPMSSVEDTTNAGQIYLYDRAALTEANPTADVVILVSPQGGDLLGTFLTTMPFRVDDLNTPLLVSSAKQSALVFFANLRGEPRDVRSPE